MLKPMYDTKIYSDIWNTVDMFKEDYENSFAYGCLSDKSIYSLGNLLYAEYGNSPIANYDVNQFKAKIWSIIFRFGPSWEKKLYIQEKLRNLSDEEIRSGNKSIINHAFNPSSQPSTAGLEEITEINDQNTSSVKRGKLDAYSTIYELIEADVTTEFINRFRVCFKQFVIPDIGPIYESED